MSVLDLTPSSFQDSLTGVVVAGSILLRAEDTEPALL